MRFSCNVRAFLRPGSWGDILGGKFDVSRKSFPYSRKPSIYAVSKHINIELYDNLILLLQLLWQPQIL